MPRSFSKGWNSLTIEELPSQKAKAEVCPECGVYGFHRSECPTRKAVKRESRR